MPGATNNIDEQKKIKAQLGTGLPGKIPGQQEKVYVRQVISLIFFKKKRIDQRQTVLVEPKWRKVRYFRRRTESNAHFIL
jgi:hypothetical protein